MVLQWLKRFLRLVSQLYGVSKLASNALKQHERGIHAHSVHFRGAVVTEVRFTSAYTRPPFESPALCPKARG